MTEETKEKKKTCWLAKLSMFGIIGVLVIIIAMAFPPLNRSSGLFEHMIIPFMLLLSLLFAVVSLIRIKCSKSPLKGTKTAIIVIVGALGIFMMLPRVHGDREPASRLICATNLKGIGVSIMICAADYDDRVFVANNWCDILIMEVDGDPAVFRCKDSGAINGESSYAINKNALGKKFSELPEDMVLLFETSLGRKDTKRTDEVRDRPLFSKYPETSGLSGYEKVYLDRWNQVGGPEDLTVVDHAGMVGCNVLFGDGHLEFVKTEDVGKLRWTVE